MATRLDQCHQTIKTKWHQFCFIRRASPGLFIFIFVFYGSVCGSVASDTRCPRFKSSHLGIFQEHLLPINCTYNNILFVTLDFVKMSAYLSLEREKLVLSKFMKKYPRAWLIKDDLKSFFQFFAKMFIFAINGFRLQWSFGSRDQDSIVLTQLT